MAILNFPGLKIVAFSLAELKWKEREINSHTFQATLQIYVVRNTDLEMIAKQAKKSAQTPALADTAVILVGDKQL